MNVRCVSVVFISTIILGTVEACLVHMQVEKNVHFWETMKVKRITNKSCECGKYDPDNWNSPWNLYVHIRGLTGEKTCVGTIVTSNFLVTSHKCLVISGKRTRLYDILKLKMPDADRSTVKIEDLTVTNTKVTGPTTMNFKVVDIFVNSKYAMNSELKKPPEYDMVIIKVAGNLLHQFTPICVPLSVKEPLGNLTAFYYGHTTEDSDKMLGQESDIPYRHTGVILERRQCLERLFVESSKDSKDSTLCFKFTAVESHTVWYENQKILKVEGGPVIYTPGNTNTAFLMGLASEIASSTSGSGYHASTGQEDVYFSPIKPLVKFIEYYAGRGGEKSVWCKTPEDLALDQADVSSSGNDKQIPAKWPWEMLSKPIERDESLDCVCGVQVESPGRVAGGEETSPRSYGWMVLIELFHTGREHGNNICGGTIINQQLILTAAHCVVNDYKVEEGDQRVSIDPINIDVILNTHLRRNDPEAIKVSVSAVLYYPEYFHARAKPKKTRFYDTDLALLILEDKLNFTSGRGAGLRPICLSTMDNYVPVVGKTATVAGWGLTDPADKFSIANALQQLEVPIQPLSYCRNAARSKITDNFLCAGTLNRYKDAAGGDSGGPLMMLDNQTNQWYEIGLVSFGEDVLNSSTKTAALYADVQKLMPFVDYHSKRVGAKWCKRS